MPGNAVKQHLSACTEDAFHEVAQIFRHDFVLYAGLLQSWMSLIESISGDPPAPIFDRMTRYLQDATITFMTETQPRLYPQYLPNPAAPDSQQHIYDWWDRFYADFAAYAGPKSYRLGAYLRAYLNRPEFNTIVQVHLGAAANHERIDRLMLNAYNKLSALFDADQFDLRVATMLQGSEAAATGQM